MEHGYGASQLNWVHNLQTEPINGTVTLSAMDNYRHDESTTVTESSLITDRMRELSSLAHRQGLHANARLQWKGEQGRSLVLTPFVVYSEFDNRGQIGVRTTEGAPVSDAAQTQSHSRFTMARLNGQWTERLSADDRLEVRFGAGQTTYDYRMDQTGAAGVTTASGQPLLRNGFETQSFADKSYSLHQQAAAARDTAAFLVHAEQHGAGDLLGRREVVGDVLGDLAADERDAAGVRFGVFQEARQGDLAVRAHDAAHVEFAVRVAHGQVGAPVADVAAHLAVGAAFRDDPADGAVALDAEGDAAVGLLAEHDGEEQRGAQGAAEGGRGGLGEMVAQAGFLDDGGAVHRDEAQGPLGGGAAQDEAGGMAVGVAGVGRSGRQSH